MESKSVQQKLQSLAEERKTLEKELMQITDFLVTNKVVTGSLVDDEGYPRADIDVYNVRIMRNRKDCLQNDLKQIMKQIEFNLH